MKVFWFVVGRMQKVGLFVSGVVNYVLLLVVYVVGVGVTWGVARVFGKRFLDCERKSSFWQDVKSDASLERARRMF